MIKHDKCAEFESKIISLESVVESMKDEIEKLNQANERLVKKLMEEMELKNE